MEKDETDTSGKDSMRSILRQRLRRLVSDVGWMRRLPVKGALVTILLLLAVWQTGRWAERSFLPVQPGEAGIAVNRYTGTVRVLPAGTHFLPKTFYELVRFRVSDRLLAGPASTFNVSTKDGLSVGVAVQARWAIDKAQLLSKWSAFPADPETEIVAPVLASAFRSAAPAYDALSLLAEKRDELANAAAQRARPRLAESGIVLNEVLVGDLKLPPEFERGRLALLEEAQKADQTEANLRLKKQQIEQGRLEAEAQKVRSDKVAEAQASQRLIAAKAESDAMTYILPLKEKEIKQKELEAEAEKGRKLKDAESLAQTMKIQAEADAHRRRTMADAEAYAIRQTTLAQFENLKREVELIEANPTWVNKTLAEKLGDKVQVIVMPHLTADVLAAEAGKRIANGQSAVPARRQQN